MKKWSNCAGTERWGRFETKCNESRGGNQFHVKPNSAANRPRPIVYLLAGLLLCFVRMCPEQPAPIRLAHSQEEEEEEEEEEDRDLSPTHPPTHHPTPTKDSYFSHTHPHHPPRPQQRISGFVFPPPTHQPLLLHQLTERAVAGRSEGRELWVAWWVGGWVGGLGWLGWVGEWIDSSP